MKPIRSSLRSSPLTELGIGIEQSRLAFGRWRPGIRRHRRTTRFLLLARWATNRRQTHLSFFVQPSQQGIDQFVQGGRWWNLGIPRHRRTGSRRRRFAHASGVWWYVDPQALQGLPRTVAPGGTGTPPGRGSAHRGRMRRQFRRRIVVILWLLLAMLGHAVTIIGWMIYIYQYIYFMRKSNNQFWTSFGTGRASNDSGLGFAESGYPW
jgi:hypothetical protein